jgi:hypothetical protein
VLSLVEHLPAKFLLLNWYTEILHSYRRRKKFAKQGHNHPNNDLSNVVPDILYKVKRKHPMWRSWLFFWDMCQSLHYQMGMYF